MGKILLNEIGSLAQGMPGWVEGTNMIFFKNKEDRFKDLMYGHIIYDYREGKAVPYWARLTVRGINYPEDCF